MSRQTSRRSSLLVVRPACGPGSLPAGIHTDGSDPPRCVPDTPPVSASDFNCPARCPARCHGTGAPLDSHLGGRQPDGGPDREAVNRPSHGRLGGRAVGELLQEDETIGRLLPSAGRAQESSRLPAVIAFSSRAISWRMSGSALVGPAGSAAPWPSPFWVQSFSTGAARSAAAAPVPTATTCTANVAARSSTAIGNLNAK